MGKVLDELLDLHCWSLDKTKAENREHIDSLKQAIVEAVEGLLPDKISIEFSKYHHQTQVDGWNDYRAAVLQAIKEWQ